MAQFIDLTATAAVGRKAEREVYALAGAEIARAALRQWSPCRQRDRELQTQALKDLDALAIEVEDFGRS